MQPVISVIIPTLNEENFLPNLLFDLKKQTEKNFEVIVSDGLSTDETKKRAIEFKDDLNLHVIESPKRHLSFQRNLGAREAKGSYLFFLDADTRIKPDAIEKALMHITKEQYGLYLPLIKPTNPKLRYKFLVSFAVNSIEFLNKLNIPLSIGPLILIRKDLFDKIGGFDLKTTASEDHRLVIKSHKLGEKAHFLSDVGCFFSMRRLESDGILSILWKYTLFTAETLVRGGVYQKATNYEMGGQYYKKAPVKE
jgi:glycosyltransferase involved in cell wall biosynthesis